MHYPPLDTWQRRAHGLYDEARAVTATGSEQLTCTMSCTETLREPVRLARSLFPIVQTPRFGPWNQLVVSWASQQVDNPGS